MSRKNTTYHINQALKALSEKDNDVFLKHRNYLDALENSSPLCRAYLRYVDALTEHGKEQRTELLKLAFDAFKEQSDERGMAVALLDISNAASDPKQGLAYAVESLHVFEKCEDQIGMSKALMNIGAFDIHLLMFTKGRGILQKALRIQQASDDPFGVGLALLNIASSHIYEGNNADALLSAAESVRCFENMYENELCQDYVFQTNGWVKVPASCEGYLATAYNNYGNALGNLGEHAAALEAYSKALDLMRKAKDLPGQAMVLNQIGEALREQGDFVNAEDFYRQSKQLFEETGTSGYMYAVACQSVGQACASQNKHDEALAHFEQALAQFRQADNKAGEAEALILLGELYAADGDDQMAASLLQKGLSIAKSVSLVGCIVRGNRAMGAALKHVNSSRAKKYLTQALLLAQDHGLKLEEQNTHHELSSYYKIIGDTATALFHYERYHALEKEIFTAEADRKMKNLQILHDVERYKQSLEKAQGQVHQLEIALEARTKELSALAERIVEKKEFLDLVERGLERIIHADPSEKDHQARKLLDDIRNRINIAKDFHQFIEHFTAVHHRFVQWLTEMAPDITKAQLHVCVLLRLAMSTKEIADVLNLEVKTIQNHSFNIHKKLRLPPKQHLGLYLLNADISGQEKSED